MKEKNEQNKEKMEQLISLKDAKTYRENPFVKELGGKMYLKAKSNMILARNQKIIETSTGEILADTPLIGKRKVVDKSQFAKIYASEIGILHDLSKAGILVFMHLSKVMDYEQKALFDYKTEYDLVGYKSHKQALKGLRELITKEIVAPHTISGIWWLNPVIVCKGERFAKYTEYLTVEEAKKTESELLKTQGEVFISTMGESVTEKYKRAKEDK